MRIAFTQRVPIGVTKSGRDEIELFSINEKTIPKNRPRARPIRILGELDNFTAFILVIL